MRMRSKKSKPFTQIALAHLWQMKGKLLLAAFCMLAQLVPHSSGIHVLQLARDGVVRRNPTAGDQIGGNYRNEHERQSSAKIDLVLRVSNRWLRFATQPHHAPQKRRGDADQFYLQLLRD